MTKAENDVRPKKIPVTFINTPDEHQDMLLELMYTLESKNMGVKQGSTLTAHFPMGKIELRTQFRNKDLAIDIQPHALYCSGPDPEAAARLWFYLTSVHDDLKQDRNLDALRNMVAGPEINTYTPTRKFNGESYIPTAVQHLILARSSSLGTERPQNEQKIYRQVRSFIQTALQGGSGLGRLVELNHTMHISVHREPFAKFFPDSIVNIEVTDLTGSSSRQQAVTLDNQGVFNADYVQLHVLRLPENSKNLESYRLNKKQLGTLNATLRRTYSSAR
jgi:hypothetical protein